MRSPMRRSVRILLLLAMVPLLAGMGSLAEGPADKVPKVNKNYHATYIDQLDVMTECTEVSIEGNTFIEGKRGEGSLAIDFGRIKNILFRMSDNELIGQVRLFDGSETVLTLKKDKKAYGRTRYGAFQIRLADLKKMVISPAPVVSSGN